METIPVTRRYKVVSNICVFDIASSMNGPLNTPD